MDIAKPCNKSKKTVLRCPYLRKERNNVQLNSDRELLSREEREDIRIVGERVCRDVCNLLSGSSPTTRISYEHAPRLVIGGSGAEFFRSLQIVLFFTVSELCA